MLRPVADGLSDAEITTEAVIAAETVETHVPPIPTELDLRDRVQAVVLGHRTGLVPTTRW